MLSWDSDILSVGFAVIEYSLFATPVETPRESSAVHYMSGPAKPILIRSFLFFTPESAGRRYCLYARVARMLRFTTVK